MKSSASGRRRKSGYPSWPKIGLAGGAVACGVILLVALNSSNNQVPLEDLGPRPSVPVASGEGVGSPLTDDLPTESAEDQNHESGVMAPSHEVTTGAEPEPAPVHFTDDNFDLLASDPDKFANTTAAISGKVYSLADQSSGTVILVTFRINNQAIESDESRASIMFQGVKRTAMPPLDISVEDCISVQGKVRGGMGDTSSLGQPIRVPVIDSTSVTRIECIDSSMPPLTTMNSSLSQSYAGIVLTAEKVQTTGEHLRVKIVAQNSEGGDSVYFREKESHAEYNGRSYHSLNHLPIYGVYKIGSTIPAESEVTGYLFFEPVQGFTGGPIVFRIVVEKVGISESEKSTFILKI